MDRRLRSLGLAIVILTAATLPAFGRTERAKADPPPNVPLTVAVIDAGGGAQHYDTVTLIHTLAGHLAGLELIRLRMAFGKANVASFLTVFNFAVADIVTIFKNDRLSMDVAPAPDPHDGKALSAALIAQATPPGGALSVDTMLDHLLSPPMHARVRSDIVKQYGVTGDDNFRAVLLHALQDMKLANHL